MEIVYCNMLYAMNSGVSQPQGMVPADKDGLRDYWCRETNGEWTIRNRVTIESGDIGDCDWYTNPYMNHAFYAVLKEKQKKDD